MQLSKLISFALVAFATSAYTLRLSDNIKARGFEVPADSSRIVFPEREAGVGEVLPAPRVGHPQADHHQGASLLPGLLPGGGARSGSSGSSGATNNQSGAESLEIGQKGLCVICLGLAVVML